MLFYADDFVIFYDCIPKVKMKISTLEWYYTCKQLKVNSDKTKIVKFYESRTKIEKDFLF